LNCASNRLPVSVMNYSKALAWFSGADSVSIEENQAVAPYWPRHGPK